MASAAVPLLVWLAPRPVSLAMIGLAAMVALLVEFARTRTRWARYHFLLRTRRLLRPHERHGLAGATYMAIAYFVAAAVFPRPIAVVAMLYNALGDAAAAIIGRRWGAHRTKWGKSWEGAAAGFAVSLGAGLAVPGIPPMAAVMGAAAAAGLEFLPGPVDDNIRSTLGGGAVLWAAVLLSGSM
jgi:dolichol kinase